MTFLLAAKCLRIAAPIAAAAAGLPIGVIPPDLKPKLDFMDKLTGALLKGKDRPSKLRVRHKDLGWSREEGAGLRAFHELLRQQDKDRAQAWGGLRRVTTPTDDVLWVCPRHYREEYDRGLPVLK